MRKDSRRHLESIEAFILRNDCDYLAPFEAEESQAETTLQRARELVDACQKLCQ